MEKALAENAERDELLSRSGQFQGQQVVEHTHQGLEEWPDRFVGDALAGISWVEHLAQNQLQVPGRAATRSSHVHNRMNERSEPVNGRGFRRPAGQLDCEGAGGVPDRLLVQPLLSPEVVADGRYVRAGLLADFAQRGCLAAFFRKYLSRNLQQSVAGAFVLPYTHARSCRPVSSK
jgi:hypothetical protein